MSTALIEAVTRHLQPQGDRDGWFSTAVDGLHIMRLSELLPPSGTIYKPSLCITLQGAKEVNVGESVFSYGEMSYLLVAVEVPAFGRLVQASKERPYLGVTIELDVGVLREVMDELEDVPVPSDDRCIGVFAAALEGALADAVMRLVQLLDKPQAISILKPAIMRELCYWLLTGPHAGEVCKLVLPHTHLNRVAEAIYVLRDNYAKPIRVEDLAAAARMGLSSFHQHFKTLTSMTPLQYQKQLRLLEARRLMATEEMNVSNAAFQVGYESASQFSREYTRMFGVPPKRDAMELKSLAGRFATPIDTSKQYEHAVTVTPRVARSVARPAYATLN